MFIYLDIKKTTQQEWEQPCNKDYQAKVIWRGKKFLFFYLFFIKGQIVGTKLTVQVKFGEVEGKYIALYLILVMMRVRILKRRKGNEWGRGTIKQECHKRPRKGGKRILKKNKKKDTANI